MSNEIPIIGVTREGDRDYTDEGPGRVDPEKVREQLESIRDALAPIMSDPRKGEVFYLSEVSVALGITASGEVGFIFAKTTVELSATITLTFSGPKTP